MSCKVHRVRYYNPKPQPINCASLNKSTKHLAIARGDASIEIWDVNYAPHPIKFIPGVENGSVEALGWVNERLLSTGLGGALVEWNLDTLTVKTTTLLTGYAAWCLDVSPDNTLAAAGTEQGYINLYSVEHDQIVYKKLFDKQEGRILCCKFNNTGKFLATGSINTIRVWNVESGHAISRMSVTRRSKQVIVWCLGFLSDNVVVSGDSLGRLSFWDSTIGDQIESFTTHKADITALVVSDDEQNIYCAGVDPLVLKFTRVQQNQKEKCDKQNTQWARNVQMNIHEHDVRVLITNENQLISAGVSGYLVFSSYPPRWIMRIPPMIVSPRSSICAKKKLLLLRYSNYLEVWKLGTYAINKKGTAIKDLSTGDKNLKDGANTENVELDTTDVIYKDTTQDKNVSLKITEKPVKLVSIQTKKKKQMHCCEMSPNGEFIFYSTDSDVRMLKLETEDEQNNIYMSRLSVCEMKSACDRMSFSGDSRWAAAHCAGAIHVLQLHAAVGATLAHTINTQKYLKSKTLLHLKISDVSASGAMYMVGADTAGGVCVWSLHGNKFKHYVTLPTYHCVPSALHIDSQHETLYLVYVDQMIVEYQLLEKKFMEWPEQILPPQWFNRTSAVHSISRHPQRNAIVFQDQNSVWIIEKEYGEGGPLPNKMKKQQNGNAMQLPFNIIPVKYLAGYHWIDKDEALTIELLPGNILDQLPPIVAHKRH